MEDPYMTIGGLSYTSFLLTGDYDNDGRLEMNYKPRPIEKQGFWLPRVTSGLVKL